MTCGRLPARTRTSSGSAVVRAPRARPQAAAPRAPRPATRCGPGSRAARCHWPGGGVTREALVAGGAVRRGELVKVLGNGELSVALRVSAHAVSASAQQKIEAAGGTVTLLG